MFLLQEEMVEHDVTELENEVTRLNAVIVCMETRIVNLITKVLERDETIRLQVCHVVLAIPFTTVKQEEPVHPDANHISNRSFIYLCKTF